MKGNALLVAAMIAAVQAFAVTEWPLAKLTIRAGYMNKDVCTPERIREMRECGIDTLIPGRNGETNTFDLLRANGIDTVVRDIVPGTGGDLDRGAPLARRRPLEVYDSAAKQFVPHPAVTGIDIGDEPPATDMPYLGLVAERVSELFPGRFPYLNLYPNYASHVEVGADKARSQLGTATYDEYIDEYVKWLPLNYICYDFYYPTIKKGGRNWIMRQYYANLETVANAARRTGRHMCNILLVASRPTNPVYTRENELRFQAYSAMAFGTSMIGWCCYGGGWWTNWVVDVQGRTTEQYAKLKRVNTEIRRIAPLYDMLRRVDTHFVGFSSVSNNYLAMCKTKDVARLDTGYFTEVAAETPEPLVVGEFTGRTPQDPVHALFIVGAGDPFDENPHTFTVRFKSACPVKAYGKDGTLAVTRGEDDALRVALAPNEFALVVARRRKIDYSNCAQVSLNKDGQVLGQPGTTNWAERIAAYCRTAPLQYITCDYSPYDDDQRLTLGQSLPQMYDSFNIVAQACRRTGRAFLYAPQFNTNNISRLTAENLRFQAYASMAFGAEAQMWTNSVIKRVNAEWFRIGEDYMCFRNVDTVLVGLKGEDLLRLRKVGIESPQFFNNGYFTGMCADDGTPLLVGDMVPRDQSVRQRAIFVVAAGDMTGTRGVAHMLRFRAAGKDVVVKGASGDIPLRNAVDGQKRFFLRDNRAALIILQN